MQKRWLSMAALVATGTVALGASAFVATRTTVDVYDAVGETHTQRTMPQSGLTSFSLKYDSGDHKIRAIGFLPAPDRVSVALADANGGDQYDFVANYASLPGYSGSNQVEKYCGAQNPCRIPLAAPVMPSAIFVLQGFKFWRKDGSDANVRRIMVRGSAESKSVDVAFVDDGSALYHAAVKYIYAPRNGFKHVGTTSGKRTGGAASARMDAAMAGTILVTGFDVQFDNGDHHLGNFAVKTGPGRAVEVVFNDQNTDDPFRATVDYAIYAD